MADTQRGGTEDRSGVGVVQREDRSIHKSVPNAGAARLSSPGSPTDASSGMYLQVPSLASPISIISHQPFAWLQYKCLGV